MNLFDRTRRAAPVCALLLLGACGAAPRDGAAGPLRPGAPGEASRPATAAELGTGAEVRHSEADVRFMQDMIVHHRQALEMTALVPGRTGRDDVRVLARRLELSQDDEIRMMERWLERRGQPLPGPHAHHGTPGAHGTHGTHGAGAAQAADHRMPGMLTDDELAQLAAAAGDEFDRLFLEYMIRHHEGALVMVAELLATRGAAREVETYQFAAHVDSDQRIEIERMRRMLSLIQ